jgi:hypothetical protein
MSDIVKQLLSRSSDEAGIGWTPTTVVHVPASLLHDAADTITALRAAVATLKGLVERLKSDLRAYEEEADAPTVCEGATE